MFRLLPLLLFAFAFSADLPPDTANGCDSLKDLYSQARCLEAQKRSSDALFIMHSVIKKDSSFQKSLFYLQLLIQCRDKIVLKKFVPIFVSRFLNAGDVTIECARGYSIAGDWKKGITLLEREYARKRRFTYLTEMTAIYIDHKEYESAQSMLEKSLATDSTYAEAYFIRGKLVFKRGLIQRLKDRKTRDELFREALGQYALAARFDSTNYRYFSEIGDMYDSLSVWDSTALFYRKAVALAPRNFDLLFKFGKRLYGKREYTESLEILEQAFSVDSLQVDLILQIEETHKRLGDYEAYFLTGQERLANAMPDTLSIRYNLALEYLQRKMPEKAEEAFKKVLEKNGDFAEANKGLSALYLQQGRYEEALPYLAKQSGARASTERDQNNLAQTYLLTGDTASGVSAYEKAMAMNSGNTGAAFFLGTYYYNEKKYEDCVRVFKDGLAYAEPAAAARMAGGSLFHLKREPERALGLLKQCAGTKEDDEMLHYMLAALYESLHKNVDAVIEYEKCLNAAPDSQNAEYYRSRIKAMRK